jgi:SRSO17 transposase
VAQAPWSDPAVLTRIRELVLPSIVREEPIQAWIIDDTSYPKKGQHSVGVARQYCGERGKQDNCQVAVSLSVATHQASLPIAYRLYLPKEWVEDAERRARTGVPEDVTFQTKPEIALQQMRQMLAAGVPAATVLADPAYGNDGKFRRGITELGLPWIPATPGEASGVRPSPFVRSRSRRWPRNLPRMPGRRSPGARAAAQCSPRGLPGCGCGRRMNGVKAAILRLRNGW